MSIKLGQKVRDKVTGLVGIATCRSTFLTGCDRIAIQPEAGSDGKVPNSYYVDEPQLVIIDETPVMEKPAKKKERGGPQHMPVNSRNP
jgi:hypothetical protein